MYLTLDSNRSDRRFVVSRYFLRIKAGCYEGIINVRDELRLAVLKVVFVGSSKECLSIVSSSASVHSVCSVFGAFLKFEVEVDKETSTCPISSVPYMQPNAFTMLMQAQRALQFANNGLPNKKTVRTQKDRLFNDIRPSLVY